MALAWYIFSTGFLSFLCQECCSSLSCPFSSYPVWQTSKGLAAHTKGKNHLLGVFQLLSLDLVHLGILPLNTEYLKWSSIYPHWYVQQDVPSRYQISRLGSRLTSTLIKIFPFLPLLFSLPKEPRSKKKPSRMLGFPFKRWPTWSIFLFFTTTTNLLSWPHFSENHGRCPSLFWHLSFVPIYRAKQITAGTPQFWDTGLMQQSSELYESEGVFCSFVYI